MTQKVLAGRADDPELKGELVRVKVDQVILAREPHRVLGEAMQHGMKKCAVEVAVAYDTRCVTSDGAETAADRTTRAALATGLLLCRPGIGFPAPVHLERFGSPARLALTDEPRLAAVGGAGMLTLVAAPSQLAEALTTGAVWLRPPRSIQVLLSGRIRPFVCVRDVALELIRRGLGEIVQRVDREHRAPVVIEFTGPSARLLSVPDRAVLAALGPHLGAAAAIFVSDEKTEVYLRDQRRSKAHRSLLPDPGAPCDDVISVDLSAVDPLVMDEAGVVRPVRELAGKPVLQVVLGGDTGASLRDLLAAAALLKSKRVPSRLDLLIAPPSRQALEVLAHSGALVDLIATGARLIEPDQRLVTGELYPPPAGGVSLRTCDPEPSAPPDRRFVVASAETIAYAVASGSVGDPRSFKRPVRVTVPRTLPTDDVLIVRKGKGKAKAEGESGKVPVAPIAAPSGWNAAVSLVLVKERTEPSEPSAMLLGSLDAVRWAARYAPQLVPNLRAVIAEHLPAGVVPVFAALGIAALSADAATFKQLSSAASISLPAPGPADEVVANAGGATVSLSWVALGIERAWTSAGTARGSTVVQKPAR
ncbi:MAG: 3-isopropylmalate dehydratase [Myxococcales bacterium]|nr:3-isopropylmalate dehydratase [Myxococcales bacterium]